MCILCMMEWMGATLKQFDFAGGGIVFDCWTANDLIRITSTRMKAIIPFVASLLICSFACNLSAGTRQIRVSVQAEGRNGDDARMVSALSRELRKLDGVSVTDTQPPIKIFCVVIHIHTRLEAYATSVAVTDRDGRLFAHFVHASSSIDEVAHEIAVNLDGKLIEPMRRAMQRSSTP
jgi:hypothetical protein